MSFYKTVNNASATLTAPHTIGDGVLHVSPITPFGLGGFPIRVTCFRQSDNANVIYSIGSSGATTLNITGVLEGTADIDLAELDVCQADITAGAFTDIHDAIGSISLSGGGAPTGTSGAIPIYSNIGLAEDPVSFSYDKANKEFNLEGVFLGKAPSASSVLTASINSISITSDLATATTTSAHGFRPYETVSISNMGPANLNGNKIVVSVPSSTQFTFTQASGNIPASSVVASATLGRLKNVYEITDQNSDFATFFDRTGALTFRRNLTAAPGRWGDGASLIFQQSYFGVVGGNVAVAFYDRNFLFNETLYKTNLSLQSYFLDDGSYYSGRSFIISQDRNKLTGQISEMGGQTMVGASCDINAPAFKAGNQLNMPGERYRYCYASIDMADVHPLYPAGGAYSDRGFGKTKWVCGPKGEQLWGTFLNPSGDSSDPELHRLAKLHLHPITNHLTVEGPGSDATTTYLDLFAPSGGNSVLQLGSRYTQGAMFIGTAASTTGIGQIGLGGVSFINMYNNPIGVAGVSVAIGVDDNGSVLTVDNAPNNVGVAVATFRSKLNQIGDIIRVQDKNWAVLWHITANGQMGANVAVPTAQIHVAASSTALTTTAFQAITGQVSNLTEWRNVAGSPTSVMNASGWLGLGLSLPSALLEVRKPTGGRIASFGANATSHLFTIGYEDNGGLIAGSLDLISSPFGPFVFNTQSNNDIYLMPHGTGKVGIYKNTEWRNASSVVTASVNAQSGSGVFNGIYTKGLQVESSGVDFNSSVHLKWSNSNTPSGVKDVGLKRSGPGELSITDGGSGVANLAINNLIIGNLTGMIKATAGELSVATEGTDYLNGSSNKLPMAWSFAGGGVPSVADDVSAWMYVAHNSTAIRLTLSAKVAPTGNFQVTIKKSTDNGSTFPTTVATVTAPSGSRLTTTTTIANASLSAGNYLRCDINSVNGADSFSARLEALGTNT